MPPTLPSSSTPATSSSSGYGGGGSGLAAERRVLSSSCRDDYHPSDVSSSSASSVSHGQLSESRETVLSGSKPEPKGDGDQKEEAKQAAAAGSEALKQRSERNQKPKDQCSRPKDLCQDGDARRLYRQTKYLQSGCLSDVDAEEIYGYRCRFVPPPSSLRLPSGEPAAYSSMGDICYQVGLRGCETDLRGACLSPACYFGCPMGCGDHAGVDRCAPLGEAPPGRLIPSSSNSVGPQNAGRLNPGPGGGGAAAVPGHFGAPHGHPSLPPYYANAAAVAAAAAGVVTNKKRNSALSRIFPTLRASRKGASGTKRNAKPGKTGNDAEAGFHRKCADDNLAADPLIKPALSEWSDVPPRLPLRNLNQALESCDDRHSDPGTQDGHQYAVPIVGPPSHLVSCSACSLDPSSEFYPPGRISISEAVHRYKEIERRKKEKNSPVSGASPARTMMTPNHAASPVVHERADSDSTNFSSMNAPSSPPSESGSSTHPLIPPSSGRSSFSEDRMSMFGADRRKKDSSGGPTGKGGVWSYRKTALNDTASPPPSPAPVSPPLFSSNAPGGAVASVALGGIGGVGGGPSGGGVVPIAYARAVCSSYESGPPAGTAPSGRILDFKKGDAIEVLWSNGNGAWIGRCNGKMGWFPASSVMLVSPAMGIGNGGMGIASLGGAGIAGWNDPQRRDLQQQQQQQPPSIASSIRPRPARPTWGTGAGKQSVS